MKIGIDIRCLTESQYSGISEYTHNLLKSLFLIDSKNQYFLFYNSAKRLQVPKFNFSNITYKDFKYPNKIFNLGISLFKITAIDKMIGNVDVFLTPSFLFTNLSSHCKKILVVHDLSFELYPEFFTLKKRLWHKLIGPKKLCQQADVIIAISENTKNDLINIYGIRPEKIKVIYQGINEMFFQPINESEKQKIKEKYNLPDNYLLYLGNLEPRKNVETLIMAFAKVKDESVKLVITGGEAWKYKKIYQLWQKSPAQKRIKFLGYVDSNDKPALYSLAKIFIYPSIYEGFGLPPLEAMSCGTPVITSFNSSLVEAVGDAGLLIDPNNSNELGVVINQLLADQNLQNLLKNKGLKHCQQFRWAKAAAEVLKIIESGIEK